MDATSGATIVMGSSTFALQGPVGGSLDYTVPEPLHLLGDGVGSSGAFQSTQGTNSFARPISLMTNTSIAVGADSLNLTGVVAGQANLNKKGTGTLRFSNPANKIIGDLTIESGAVELNAN